MTRQRLHYRLRDSLERLSLYHRDARLVVRAQALLWCNEGVSIEEIAQRLRVTRQTIYNWIRCFQLRQGLPLELRLADTARSGRPATAKGIIDPLIEQVIDLDPRTWGYRTTVWTAPLLVIHLREEHNLRVSPDSVSRALTRLRIRWKRPRHVLARRSSTWRQAKGGLKRGFGADRAA